MKVKFFSLLIILTMLSGTLFVPNAAAFNDIPDPDTAAAASVLSSMGIASGTSATTYNPGGRLTRAQFCALAIRAMGLEEKVPTNAAKELFSDVQPGSWFTGYVNLAYTEGIINGYGNGKFGPNDSVTYGQVATVLLRMLQYSSDDVGNAWPSDYVTYADELGLSDGVALDAYSTVTRGQAAILLTNTLKTAKNGSSQAYYETRSGVESTQTVILLDNDSTGGGSSGQLMAYEIGGSEASVAYYQQKYTIPDDLIGQIGTLLLNSAGKTVGFIPDGTEYVDVVVSSAKASSITAASGATYRINGSAVVIANDSTYTYNQTGYMQVNNQSGDTVRIFYDEDGTVRYVYIPTGTSSDNGEAAVAETNTAASELARKLRIAGSAYSISKNGAAASIGDVAQYDVAYYDPVVNTMFLSDYKLTGYIEAASPGMDAAETITIAGCTLEVLESAWDTLNDFSLGSSVTLLLTDDCAVAAVYPSATISSGMMGILSFDGNSVTLTGSGLVLTADTISASDDLHGALVHVTSSSKTSLRCSPYIRLSPGTVDTTARTAGSYALAPACAIYESAGSAVQSYVYSLSGEPGKSSSDFNDITWTTSLPSSSVSFYRLNSAGQIDILLLNDVTGNCYEYGKLETYSGASGINLGTASMTAFNSAVTITNGNHAAGSEKYLDSSPTGTNSYAGISLYHYNDTYQRTASISTLTKADNISTKMFTQDGEDWHGVVSEYEVPVSSAVQVYIESVDRWYRGEEGLRAALSSATSLTVYYDRALTTGAQIRIIVVQE